MFNSYIIKINLFAVSKWFFPINKFLKKIMKISDKAFLAHNVVLSKFNSIWNGGNGIKKKVLNFSIKTVFKTFKLDNEINKVIKVI